MVLGLKRNEVRLVTHDDAWKEEFRQVKANMVKSTSLDSHQIEHVGSTAIKGIMAKPVIDIVTGIESLEGDLTELIKGLKDCGFYRLKVERPNEIVFAKFTNEIVFAKFTDETFESKTHFIHLTKYKGTLWNNLIYFRDYLNAHPAARKEYENIKTTFVEDSSEGIAEYTDSKEAFVKQILSGER
ncbi:Uncharacterized protein family UPF0157 [Alkalibacterium sp. AK22]|uniref:GrpB family protein n=1 Tax=Alkalibacterium sp. AK22 TaxID=1229520 RepID=UPI00044F4FED|nr:GrpB family protein [Alkalibacterium sp. AK22]EXJ23386.1 Uncharacterized protein family UPF0157 [Alkalibacterium sp. AK22]